jgi:hypothetical protein
LTAVPPFPPDGPRCVAGVPLRFEDVAEDGRLVLESLPTALATAVWKGLLSGSDLARILTGLGILPILSRLRMHGSSGPFSSNANVEAEGTFRFAPAADGRFKLDMWADIYAPIGRTYGTVDGAGERAVAGRVLAEHVLTRPFAPPGERRVTTANFAGVPGAPGAAELLPSIPRFESILALPEGATPLEPAMRLDPFPLAFGVVHTDSNRHVNSLAYLRLFEEAALRRFVALGRRSDVLARTVDIAYRKPCFAGQVVRVAQQAFEADGRLGVGAVLVAEADAASEGSVDVARAHAYVRLGFEG